jgi:hypothetical protein
MSRLLCYETECGPGPGAAFLPPIMLYYPCPGCQKVFGTSKAVASHRRFCKAYKAAPTGVFRKCREDLLTIRTAEEAAARLRDLTAVEEPPDVPNIPEPEPEVCTQC